jgi:phage shock protein E
MSPSDWLMIAGAVAVALFLLNQRRGRISGPAARTLVASGAVLLDVRTRAEFASGHLERARNIPLDELARRLEELGPKDKPVILYCASGVRSAMAAGTLRKNGFTQLHNLGSMGRW